jgi:hypothetical protein
MKLFFTAGLILGVLSLGCIQPQALPKGPSLALTEKNVSLVISKRASKDLGPSGISDRLIFDGKIYAFATFHWDDLSTPGGEQEFEFRWFSGDKAVSSFKKKYTLGIAPHYIWVPTLVTNIGIGKGRVELYYEGKRIASKEFELYEAKWNAIPPRP